MATKKKPGKNRRTPARGRKAAAKAPAAKARKATARKATARKAPARKAPAGPAPAKAAVARAIPDRRHSQTLRLREVSAGFTVNDLPRSLAWYCEVLGFYPKQRFERDGRLTGVELVAGTVSQYLSQDDWMKGRDRRKGEGFRIYYTTTQDVDSLADRARAHGAALDEEPHDTPWGTREFSLTDPDGFKISVGRER